MVLPVLHQSPAARLHAAAASRCTCPLEPRLKARLGHTRRLPWRSAASAGSTVSRRQRRAHSAARTAGESLPEAWNGAARQSKASQLRQLLAGGAIIEAPACFDGLSARLIEEAGFPAGFLSGFSIAAARAAAPDTGLLSYSEVLDSARCAVEAAPSLPLIADGDTGYGNAMNVKRTVRGFAAAGLAGVLIEDQVWPKSCGHIAGKRVVPRDEAVSRIRAACDARDEGADIVIIARTDARQAVSMGEALARVTAFAEAGADVLFVDALASVDEMKALTSVAGAAAAVPKMANMLEGGGRTPLLPPAELAEMGFSIVAYPLSLIGVAAAAMRRALLGLRDGNIPPPEDLPSFQEIQRMVGVPTYFEEEAKYAVPAEEASV